MMPTLKPGQNLLLNNRLWSLWQVTPQAGRQLALAAIGASEAARGMTRRLAAVQYGPDLFVEQRHGGYWHANLERDWRDTNQGPVLEFQEATQLDLLDRHTNSPAQGELSNEFSWSYSRWTKYRFCRRAYYYHYYAAWEGWQPEAPAPVRTAYLLKNLTSLALWSGTLVHESIRFALARLRAGQPVERQLLVAQMYHRAQADFANSQVGRYRQQPNAIVGFQEHHYKLDLDDSSWRSAWQQAEQQVQRFLDSPLYADLHWQPADTFLDVEALRSFVLDGTTVWVQIDLARYDERMLEIYSWKSRSVDQAEVRRQMGVYGLYLRRANPEWRDIPIRGIVTNLVENRTDTIDIDPAMVESTEMEAKVSIAEMRSRLTDVEANLTKIERFPMIDDLSVCRACQYRALCGRNHL